MIDMHVRMQQKIYIILMPGAAIVIRDRTTWEMPLTAAFYRVKQKG